MSTITAGASSTADPARLDFFDGVIRDWLADDGVTIVCGHWQDGSIAELRPHGKATLSAPRYDGAFAGLRDLSLIDAEHHMHLDLARFAGVTYAISPSVCFGFKPSFEARLLAEAAPALARPAFSLALGRPYRHGRLDEQGVRAFLRRLGSHAMQGPAWVSLLVSVDDIAPRLHAGDASLLGELLVHAAREMEHGRGLNPLRAALLGAAQALGEAAGALQGDRHE